PRPTDDNISIKYVLYHFRIYLRLTWRYIDFLQTSWLAVEGKVKCSFAVNTSIVFRYSPQVDPLICCREKICRDRKHFFQYIYGFIKITCSLNFSQHHKVA